MGKLERTNFDYYLDSEKPLENLEDFVFRLRGLFYNSLTDGGVLSYNKKVLSYFPANSNANNAEGVVYAGHLITFEKSNEPLGIVTHAEAMREAPHKRPNRNTLREYLDNPSIIPSAKTSKSHKIFSKAYLLGGEIIGIVLPTIKKDEEFKGKVRPYWLEYRTNVILPLIKILWPL